MRDAIRPQCESQMRIADATDGRTNGTKKSHPSVSNAEVPNVRARTGTTGEGIDETDAALMARLLAEREDRHSPNGGVSIAWVIDEWVDRMARDSGRRWPVVRSGEREPIPWLLRASIYARDGESCKVCGCYGASTGVLELDHCIPWSAGGPDDSDNLRTLCSPCNQRRSNYIDEAHVTNLLPTTYWCIDCWTYETQRPRGAWKDGTYLGDAPLVASEERPMRAVFCAHCHYISQSDTYFVGSRGRELIAQATRFVREVPA